MSSRVCADSWKTDAINPICIFTGRGGWPLAEPPHPLPRCRRAHRHVRLPASSISPPSPRRAPKRFASR